MLVGEPPFTGATAQALIARHALDPIPQVRTVRPTVPESLEYLIGKAMAKVPADRFATAGEFRRALAACAVDKAPAASSLPHAPSAGKSIAVLPFVNLSPDPENEYFSDGLSEELTGALCKVPGLRVVARTSAFAFKGKDADVRTIGRQLNVRVVLSGSVRKAATRLRIAAQLVSVADGYHLWSEQYDRELDDVFAIQDEITGAIVNVLKLTLLSDEGGGVARQASDDVEAYELYLKGRHFWNKRTEQGVDKAIEYFRQALAHDAGYAPALAGLADCYTILGIYGARAPQQVMPLAKDAAARALSIDPSLAEAHTALGCVRATFDFDWPGAEQEFRRAIEIKPSYPTAHHWYALNCLAPQGRFDEALGQMQRAREFDPLSPVITTSVGVAHYFAREYRRAIDAYYQAIEIDAHFVMAYFFLGLAHAALGAMDDAIARLEHAQRLVGDSAEVAAALGYVYAVAGRAGEAAALLGELEARRQRAYVSPALISQVYVGLGDRERALEALQEAARQRAADLIWLRVRPVFDPLREDPRYAALVARIGLAPGDS